MAALAATAHKLLPLFTMLKAAAGIPALAWLEQRRGTADVTPEAEAQARTVLEEMEKVLEEARKQL